jgi:hypothetical protein
VRPPPAGRHGLAAPRRGDQAKSIEVLIGVSPDFVCNFRRVQGQDRLQVARRRGSIIVDTEYDEATTGVRHGDYVLDEFAPVLGGRRIEAGLEIEVCALFDALLDRRRNGRVHEADPGLKSAP